HRAARRRSDCGIIERGLPLCCLGESGKLGLLPPPLWGRAGEGGGEFGTIGASIARPPPPPPTPPHKGEGSAPSVRLVCRSNEPGSPLVFVPLPTPYNARHQTISGERLRDRQCVNCP